MKNELVDQFSVGLCVSVCVVGGVGSRSNTLWRGRAESTQNQAGGVAGCWGHPPAVKVPPTALCSAVEALR